MSSSPVDSAYREDIAGRPRGRLRGAMILAAIALLVIGAASTWAVVTILRPADDPLSSAGHSFVAVEHGSVGYAVSLNTMTEWAQQPIGTNRAAGIVTDIAVEAGTAVTSGTVLYTVDLRPVVVAQGAVPMFRSLGLDSAGADVRQLQEMLRDSGQYGGSIDGVFGEGTKGAVSRWQRTLGAQPSGMVDVGDVIFVPSLPARVTLDTAVINRGATLTGGESVVRGLSPAPTFQIPVTEAQAAMMPTGTKVEITSPRGETWEATAEEQLRGDEGAIDIRLSAPDGEFICATACSEIPPTGKTALRSRIIVVAEVEGLVVPSAALVTVADGSTAVVDEDGREVAVKVVASAKGMSAITGARQGLRVQIPGSATK
ncbi:peptidoglycan-binding protein [Microbacterium sp. Mcb102]|uniref:peptidoglycan-binding protein n=1 Tax=Microbacterium sp. Mcb102 TaxID=2926012 RepID=UPI0021C88545|nr:peptidoglycan-binding protein [Microbacterium sp. Mcb102]